MPDAMMVPVALKRPAAWWHLVLGAMLGTTVGGMVSYHLGQRHPNADVIVRLLLVRPGMVTAADRWLEQHGPPGALRQAATGVPFKVFARLAGARRLPLFWFLLWVIAGRTMRFALLAGVAAVIGRRFPELVAQRFWLIMLLWASGFGLLLWRMVRFWETDGPLRLEARAGLEKQPR